MKAKKATVEEAEETSAETLESGPAGESISSIYFKERPGEFPYNASEVVFVDDSRFLFCDNNISDAAFEMRFKPDGELLPLIRHPIRGVHPRAIDDLECMAMAEVDGQVLLFLSSSLCLKQKDLSARKKSQRGKVTAARESLIRVRVATEGRSEAEIIPCFRSWLVENSSVLGRSPDFIPNDGGLNIEGLAWDSTQNALVFGLRSPTKSGMPMLLRVKIKNPLGLWNLSNLEIMQPVTLAIEEADGRFGVRSIDYDPTRGAYLIVVGNAISGTKAPFLLYSWDGNMYGMVKRFKRISFHKKMRPEGVTHGTIGGRGVIVFVDDRGGYQFIWSDDPRLELED